MGFIKKIVKGRQKLKEFIRESRQLDDNLFLRLGKILPFLAGAKVVGKLDFPEKKIVMRVRGILELGRLRACRKEPETVAWIEEFTRPGDVFYDIGANVGAYSLVARAVTGGKSKIYAFEPGAATFAALEENIALNNAKGVIIPYRVALTAKSGIFIFHYRSKEPGSASHILTRENQSPPENFRAVAKENIVGYALDDFIGRFRISSPTHIKIDVDGAEWAVIQGAAKTIFSPELRSILVEIDEKLPSAREIKNRIEKSGFILRSKHQRGSAGKQTYNYIFVRSS